METHERLIEYTRKPKTYRIAINLYTDTIRIFPLKNQSEEMRRKREHFIESGIEALLENARTNSN